MEKGKKNPLKPGEENFDLGDSRYSTFSARANNRKMAVKKKRGKSKQQSQDVSADPSLAQTKKSNIPKPKSAKHITNKPTPKGRDKLANTQKGEEAAAVSEELPEGPFYIWNMPIQP